MLAIACSGFPIPVSRYLQELRSVEIAETEVGLPGSGTVRRWLRESPEGFSFTVLAPREISAKGFELNDEHKARLIDVAELAQTINAHAMVFAAPPEFEPNKNNRTRVREFFQNLPKRLPRAVVDLPSWSLDKVVEAVEGLPVIPAYDPLKYPEPPSKQLAYMRLHGPAGHRSRYDEKLLVKVAEFCKKSPAKATFCVFCNIDMHVNALRTLELVES